MHPPVLTQSLLQIIASRVASSRVTIALRWCELVQYNNLGGRSSCASTCTHVGSDDARQNPYSVRAVKEVEFEWLREMCPWLTGGGFGSSDQCDDYHSSQAIVAFSQAGNKSSAHLCEAGFFEPGHGKNKVDMDCGINAQGFTRFINGGGNLMEIQDYLKRLDSTGSGVNLRLEINRWNETRAGAPAIPNVHDYAHVTFHRDGSITLRECHGFGDGVTFTKEELARHDQHKLGESGTGSVELN